MRYLISTLLLFLLVIYGNAQQWKDYTSDLSVNAMALDHDTIWVGSSGGVAKYLSDGTKIASYTKEDGLADNWVSSIVIDKEGNKWFATGVYSDLYPGVIGNGITKFDGANWIKYNTANSGLPSNNMVPIGADAAGNIWFGATSIAGISAVGVVKFNGTTWTTYNTSNSGLLDNDVTGMAVDSAGNKWFATWSGVSKFDGTNWTNTYANEPSIAVDRLNNIWITSQYLGPGGGGLIQKFNGHQWVTIDSLLDQVALQMGIAIDSSNNKWFAGLSSYYTDNVGFTRVNDPWSQPYVTMYISQIVVDHNNNKWFGTNDFYGHGFGLWKLSDTSWTNINAPDSELISNGVTAATIDGQNNKWFLGYSLYGGGTSEIYKYNNNHWSFYNDSNSLSDFEYNNPVCIKSDLRGNVWLGTEYGVPSAVYKFDGTNWYTYHVDSILNLWYGAGFNVIAVDTVNNIWFGNSDGVLKFDGINWALYNNTNSGLIGYNVQSIAFDEQNNKWFGTQNGGVSEFDGFSWTNFNPANSGLADSNVQAISVDRFDNKWIGTAKKGLFKFDGNSWVNYNITNSGLTGDGITSIFIDRQNNIWLATTDTFSFPGPTGVSKFDGHNWATYTNVSSGIIDNDVTSIFEDIQGNIWFSTRNMGVCELLGADTTYSVSLQYAQNICSDSAITLNPVISNGLPPYTILWRSTGDSLSCYNCVNPSSTITKASIFTLTITDSLGRITVDSIFVDYCGASSVKEINGPASLRISPNPSTGQFIIQLPNTQNNYPAEVYNTLGQKIEQLTLSAYNNTLNLTNQPTGMYFVYLQTETGRVGAKVVVER